MLLVFGKGLLGTAFEKYSDALVLSHRECDVTYKDDIYNSLVKYKPDKVINCTGIVPKNSSSIFTSFEVNSYAPRLIASCCHDLGIKFLQISSNCVFGGMYPQGPYTEDSEPDPIDFYGLSKLLGENINFPVIRTSFIGLPDPNGHGLLSWASEQEEIVGYDYALWNGLTTKELVQVICKDYIREERCISHIHSIETISKYDLLVLSKNIFGWEVEIKKESEVHPYPKIENRTLSTNGWGIQVTKSIRQQLEELANDL